MRHFTVFMVLVVTWFFVSEPLFACGGLCGGHTVPAIDCESCPFGFPPYGASNCSPNNFANPPGDTLVSLTCTDGIRTAPPTLCQHKSLGCLNTPVKMTMVTNCEQGNQNFIYNTYICCQDNP